MTRADRQLYLGLVQVFEDLKSIHKTRQNAPHPGSTVVTIGNFDGVHLGHRELLETLVREAKLRKLPSVVITFDPHPVQLLFPERKLQRIFAREDQVQEMSNLGVNTLVIQKFTNALSKITAEEFLKEWILEPLNPQLLIVGYDFSFGANRSGSIPQLLEFGKKWGFELMIIPPQKLHGSVVSSTRVRQSILAGDFEMTAQLLGRPFYLQGKVKHGEKRGRIIGVPTANLSCDAELIPQPGVYVTQTLVNKKTYPSVTNIGMNPTFTNDGSVKIETHILDFSSEIYDQTIKIDFLKKIRDEQKFASIDDLKRQIGLDILKVREYYKT